MIIKIREKKETGFSLLELSVAVGVAAIVATAGIIATTAFIGSAQDKRDSYTSNANTSVLDAESASLALGASGIVEEEIVPSTDKAATTTILASTGETVLGSNVTVSASGLKPGAAYTVLLQSDPVTLASGIVPATGILNETVTIPADTPSGWHSITLTTTYYDDTPLSNQVWLEIAGNGTLSATSETEPIIAAFDLSGYTYSASTVAGAGGANVAQTWSESTPVLKISEYWAGNFYTFVELHDTEVGIDYYDNPGNNNPTVIDNVYYLDTSGVSPSTTEGNRHFFIHYDEDPTTTNANKLPINWVNACVRYSVFCPSGK